MLSHLVYNVAIKSYTGLARIYSLFSPKAGLWVNGRENVFQKIEQDLEKKGGRRAWFHCASLGEYEQAKPVIVAFKAAYPEFVIAVTFFSPSGYEQKKNEGLADVCFYLPIDSPANAGRFVELVKPSVAVFIKYEFWYNYLSELNKRQIPALLVSAVFREGQPFFKWYGKLFLKMLGFYTHIFVQDKRSMELLKAAGIPNVTLSHDTRFDRVYRLREEAGPISFIDVFRQGKPLLIGGSSWEEEEKIMSRFYAAHQGRLKIIIAPHDIGQLHIKQIRQRFGNKVLLYSDINEKNAAGADVLIIDSIGLLARLYKYGNYAFVGGGFGRGLHNILEPATFGLPVIIGPDYRKFNEAGELISSGGAVSVKNYNEFEMIMLKLLADPALSLKMKNSCSRYVEEKRGATGKIMDYISEAVIKKQPDS
jgi:3-deoxy-D-manno-octulosonic-acid transferase